MDGEKEVLQDWDEQYKYLVAFENVNLGLLPCLR